MNGQLSVFDSHEAMARAAAEFICDRAADSGGRFAVALSGGHTPVPVYRLLAGGPGLRRFPWARAHWFWGDERFVPATHPDSNFRLAHEAMLAHAPVPQENIHAVPTEGLGPEEAALRYERMLKDFRGGEPLQPARPLFDLNLMGIGEDGHTASLFAGQPALEERIHWVVAVTRGTPEVRITLTFSALESSRVVMMLVSGAAKRKALSRALAGDREIPAGRLRPAGEHLWFADRAAAGA